MQYQRLQSLAQESSRTAASLEDPTLLEKQVSDFVFEVNPEIKVKFDWKTDFVTVTLREPTRGFLHYVKREIEISASAPRWSG